MAAAHTRERITADEYQRMAQVGILPEGGRLELIAGDVLPMTPVGPRHNGCVGSATRAFVRAAGDEALVLPQGCSVRLDLFHEPQPDLVLLRPRPDFYTSRHGGPDDILLIVEFADTSLAYDRDTKARIYAARRIPEYWLVDLRANLVSCYSAPQGGAYRKVKRYRRGDSIAPALLPSCVIAVDALLIG